MADNIHEINEGLVLFSVKVHERKAVLLED